MLDLPRKCCQQLQSGYGGLSDTQLRQREGPLYGKRDTMRISRRHDGICYDWLESILLLRIFNCRTSDIPERHPTRQGGGWLAVSL